MLNPDVVMMQEVFVAPEAGVDTARSIAAGLPEHRCLPASARIKPREFDGREVTSISGLATLIAGEAKFNRVVNLPDLPDDRDRIAQVIDTVIQGIEMQLVNLHLSHIPGADQIRREQLEAVLKELDEKPTVIAGDFNSYPDGDAIRLLHEEFDHVFVSNVPTFPGYGVIDYFACRGFDLESAQLEPLFDGNELPKVSDHIGLGLHLNFLKEK